MDAEKKSALLKHYRLTLDEWNKICQLLGREPQGVEWALFSALWSEHCSYKSSKIHLRKFAKTMNSTVKTESGENAGVVDLGQGEKIAFKMESHNHPSFIEPYQGAATGVGGILRDIFTMGARPIALANYLCFGEPKAPRMIEIMDGVVRGISGYGNCVGVPTVTGQTQFHESYNQNVLVNAMAVGLLNDEYPMALSTIPENILHEIRSGKITQMPIVVYVGAKTGRDGVHGAAMASESFDDNSEAKRPNVQIGDPYFEKLLIESCLEVIKQDLVLAIQDMGAAGLTSSSFEMAAKSEVGMQLRLDQVPLRDQSMSPEEILLSESQERMLLICLPEKLEAIQKIFSHWGLDAAPVGQVQAQCEMVLTWHNEVLTKIDPRLLVNNAPVYEREFEARSWQEKNISVPSSETMNVSVLSSVSDLDHGDKRQNDKQSVNKQPIGKQPIDKQAAEQSVEKYFSSLVGGAKKPIYRQYDQRVGLRTAMGCGSDIGIVRLPSGRGLAVAVGCRPWVMRLDANLGGWDAVFYPAWQMAAKGARALAVTDCLNFGNPEKKEIMSQFVSAVDCICDASLALSAPVVSGNVSFYNETKGQNITSTPATGLIGLCSSVQKIPSDFLVAERAVLLIDFSQIAIKISEAQASRTVDTKSTPSAELELTGQMQSQKMAQAIDAFVQLLESQTLLSSQVVGAGGVMATLVKMCLGDSSFASESKSVGFVFDDKFDAQMLLQNKFYQLVVQPDDVEAFLKAIAADSILRQYQVYRLGVATGNQVAGMMNVSSIKLTAQNALKNYFTGI